MSASILLSRSTPASTVWHRAAFVVAVVGVSAHFALSYLNNASSFLDLQAFVRGTAALPFQSRALTGWILRGALHLHSPAASAALRTHFPAWGARANAANGWLFLLTFISIAAAILCTRASLIFLTQDRSFASFACFAVPLMAYFNYILSPDAHFFLPYDLPSLAFFCGGVLLILRRRFAPYYLVFAISCLNRETTLFLAVFFVILEWSRAGRRPSRIALHLAAQVALWLAVRLALHHLYRGNPVEEGSGFFDLKLGQNLLFLLKPQHWPTLLSNFAFTLPFLLFFHRRIPHRGLRRCLPVLALWFAVMMVVGVIIEIRIFGELISYVSLATALLLWKRLEKEPI